MEYRKNEIRAGAVILTAATRLAGIVALVVSFGSLNGPDQLLLFHPAGLYAQIFPNILDF